MPSAVPLAATDEQTLVLERRFSYGRGIVEMLATIDESGTFLLEERAGDDIRIIAIRTRKGQCRLRDLLTDPREPVLSPA